MDAGRGVMAGCERVARRGGNYNNTSNAGVAYLNCNNPRSNSNDNNGARARSRTTQKAQSYVPRAATGREGRVNRRDIPANRIFREGGPKEKGACAPGSCHEASGRIRSDPFKGSAEKRKRRTREERNER